MRRFAKNLVIGLKTNLGSASIGNPSTIFNRTLGNAAGKDLLVKLLAARHFHFTQFRQSIDDRNTDTVQTTGGLVHFRVEFTPRMQSGHDHFQSGFFGEFGMRINRNPASVIGHGQKPAVLKLNGNDAGMACDSFIHRIINHFGKQMMQCFFICTADIHTWAAADRLKTLQHFNGRSGIASLTRCAASGCFARCFGFKITHSRF